MFKANNFPIPKTKSCKRRYGPIIINKTGTLPVNNDLKLQIIVDERATVDRRAGKAGST